MNNRRSLVVLLIVFLALAVMTWLQSRAPTAETSTPTPSPETTADVQAERLYPAMQAADIRALRLQDPVTQAAFTISREADGEWESPGSAQALNQDVANAMAEAVVSLGYTNKLENIDPSRLADFGLSSQDASLFIQIVLNNGETHFVILGGVVPTGEGIYALVDERREVYVIEREGGAADFLLHYLIEAQGKADE